MKKAKQKRYRCEYCGKFISHKQLANADEIIPVHVPDTAFTTEKNYFVHRWCNEIFSTY